MRTLGWCGAPLCRGSLAGGASWGGAPGARLRDASSTSREILILRLDVWGGGGGAASRSFGILILRPGLVASFSLGMVMRRAPSAGGCSAGGAGGGLSRLLSLSFLCFFRSSFDLSRSLCLCLSFFFFSFLCLLCSAVSSEGSGAASTGCGGG